MFYYLITLINGNYSDYVAEHKFLQVKGKNDCSAAIIISYESITGDNVSVKTEDDAQIILDLWIDDENLIPKKDFEGKDIFQDKIDISKYRNVPI